MDDTTQINVTTKYNQFKFLVANRERANAHIERLKEAFVEYGNLTRVQPILVNDRMEIIDGQHRFQAAQELGEPIFYTVAPGLGINEARSMNILHKSWSTDDYARSYAESGDASYKRYLQLREQYPQFRHSVLLIAAESGVERKGIFRDFREGNMTMTSEQYNALRAKLDALDEVVSEVPFGYQQEFCVAVLKAMNSSGYIQQRMVQKLQVQGATIPRYKSIPDYLRALEDAYNYRVQDNQRVRLF